MNRTFKKKESVFLIPMLPQIFAVLVKCDNLSLPFYRTFAACTSINYTKLTVRCKWVLIVTEGFYIPANDSDEKKSV